MIKIQVNGDTLSVPENAKLTDLVTRMELDGKRFAIEVNEDIIPRSEHAQYQLQVNDQVEIVQAIGGG